MDEDYYLEQESIQLASKSKGDGSVAPSEGCHIVKGELLCSANPAGTGAAAAKRQTAIEAYYKEIKEAKEKLLAQASSTLSLA